jgi:hypothetical protein
MEQTWVGQEAVASRAMPALSSPAEVDFILVWPDSELLFQTIMSSDTANQWQMPLGTLPFLPGLHQTSTANVGSLSSFDDRGPSIGAIPSGGSHRAVHDVSKMVTSLVSLSTSLRSVLRRLQFSSPVA